MLSLAYVTDGLLADRELRKSSLASSARSGIYMRYAKRLVDIVLVLIAAPIVLPMIAVAILLTQRDGGSGIFGHSRVGRGGRRFTCWKIRTMVPKPDEVFVRHLRERPDAAQEWETHQKLTCDPRITPLGRILRKTSFDELPQLWNVLIGEMSLVGPRPFTPEQQALYESHGYNLPYFNMTPGITGLWQIGPRHQSAFSARVQFDVEYWQRISFWTDLTILASTVIAVLRLRGQ